MCGIAGAVCWEPPDDWDPSAVVAAMTAAASGRTPIGAFGHRRLAIIDLSERAAQPMLSERQPVAITYNGEIYNFRELRSQLESTGRQFRSESDTEVILQGYEQWGEGVVDRLRGMFAFAIWDARSNALLLVRDRLGIKPLYFYRTTSSVLFASEIRALLASGLVARRLDVVALNQYLTYQSVPPPRTLVAGVQSMAAGELATATRSRFERRVYWDLLPSRASRERGARQAGEVRERVKHLLRESASLHLVSDVPVGVFLSGGIDSTAVAALVRHSGQTPKTFAVTCPGTRFDEAPYARAAARACGAEHTEIVLTEAEIIDHLRNALTHVDHPSGDGINTFIVSHAVRQAGVKVALSGLGGDEFFGGYPSFERLGRLSTYAKAWRQSPESMRRFAGAAIRAVGSRSPATSKAAALAETDGTIARTFPILRQMFSEEQRRQLLDPSAYAAGEVQLDPYVSLLDEAVARRPDLDTMALVSYAEARTYMHDVLLRDTDQMSMRHALEVRVPLLDHHLVEYLMCLSEAEKGVAAGPKPLLVDSLDGMIPAECVNRPKQGFVLPFESWMRGPLRSFCEDHLGSDALDGRSVVNGDVVRRMWRGFVSGDPEMTWSRPWTLVALNAWLEATGVAA